MPFADSALVTQINNTLSDPNSTPAQRKTLLITHPILPPSGGIRFRTVDPNAAEFKDVVKGDYTKLKIGAAHDSIAFIKFFPNPKNEIGAITFVLKTPAELPTVASRNGWTPVWWLPWQSAHIVKIKIASNVISPNIVCPPPCIDPVPNPAIFFTAAINGCSVFVVGNDQSPSVYHGGVDGSMSDTARQNTELTEEAWRRLIGRANTAKNVQGIGKNDYISQLKHPHQWGDVFQPHDKEDRTESETNLSRAMLANLQQRGQLTNVTVKPWGMVFGVRDAGNNWEMTLVKNSTVEYKRIHTTKRLLRKPKVEERGETRRSNLTYDADGQERTQNPGLHGAIGGPITPIFENAPEIITCVTLGYQEFFPGRGAAQVYDPAQINVF